MRMRDVRWLLPLGLLLGGCASSGDGTVITPKSDASVDLGKPVDTGEDAGSDAPTADAPDVPAGRVCRTNDDCTSPDLCSNGQVCRFNRCVVVGGTPSCDDSIACTDDSCDATAGRCVHAPNDMRCPSDNFCAGETGCVRELPCEIGDATCARLNGDPCTGTWSCDPARLRCVRSAPYNCADTDTCTMDVCMLSGTAPMCLHNGPDYMTDVANCGSCGHACPAGANQTATCMAGACAATCNAGFVDADHMAANGCECNSSAADDPDLMFRDTNCDGIDGDASRAIFVSTRGNDSNPGTMAMPKRTLAAAIAMARMATPVKSVYAALGTYGESVTLAPGVNLYGGYNDEDGWSRASANSTEIDSPGTVGLSATNVLVATEVQLFSIHSQTATMPGESSYGVRVLGSSGPVLLRGCSVTSSDGADGNDGADGTSGGSASGSSSPCGANGGGGGGGGGGNNAGGSGAAGAQAPGGGAAGGGGNGGGGSSCTDSCRRNNGAAGGTGLAGSNGINGVPGDATGQVSMAGVYSPRASGRGSNGASGGGAGGGGGGGGTEVTRSCGGSIFSPCRSRSGGAGGSGGGGGCAGTAGNGGTGGGGSFAVVSLASQVRLENCRLQTGTGGRGGRGGNGGTGGLGGTGTAGGDSGCECTGIGGTGGNGGAGGAAGSGAGGPGGPTVCIAFAGDLPGQTSTTCTLGRAGTGGTGGRNAVLGSASNGPGGIRVNAQPLD